jgi:Carboxypeptidase regulatory-like domain
MRFLFVFVLVVMLLGGGVLFWTSRNLKPEAVVYYAPPNKTLWNFQSIDTMKYSRDIAREKLKDESFDAVIERQVKAIADTGATHIAIATPYDEEFAPFLKRWVDTARTYGLNVWFRGNFSGWEGWFEYPSISREEHLKKTEDFILAHPDLFQDGDAFSNCPECENGGPGDPRLNGDVIGHRQFLVAEYGAMQRAFKKINKNVRANFFSMNGDVARLVMDKETTRELGGIVTIDHYVKTPEQLAKDVEVIARSSGGKIILGEFGAPIPDIHGNLSEAGQRQWIARTLELLETSQNVEGVNYWLSVGGSTELWDANGNARQGVGTLTSYFQPDTVYGFVRDELGRPIEGALVHIDGKSVTTDAHGHYALSYLVSDMREVSMSASGFIEQKYQLSLDRQELNVVFVKEHKDWQFRILEYLHK